MSGVEAPPLDQTQATDILQAVQRSVRVTLTSPLQIEPGHSVTAALVPAAPEIDASELANGVLNLGLVAKDVVYKNANVVDVPSSGDLAGDTLATTANLAGGQPFPVPVAIPTGTATPTATNIPGLLGQLFGTVGIPRIKVQLELRWILRDQQGNELKEEEGAFIASQGLANPNVSLLIPPVFEEWRPDTVKNPPTTVYCLSAKVTLTLRPAPPLTFEVGPVPVIVLPLLIPTIVVLFSEPSFGTNLGQRLHGGDVTEDHIQEEDNVGLSSALMVVPGHSPFASAGALFKALHKVEKAVDALSGFADFLGFFLPLGDLLSVPEQPRLRFVAANGVPKFSRIILKPKTFFFVTYDHDTFDDKVFSILVVGLPGTRVKFFSDIGFSETSNQGFFTLEVGPELFVAVRTLDTSVQAPPETFPPGRALPFGPGTGRADTKPGNDGLWHTDMSSMKFDDQWLVQVQDRVDHPIPNPPPVCKPLGGAGADLAAQARAAGNRLVTTVQNMGPDSAAEVSATIEGGNLAFGAANPSQGSVTGSGLRREWTIGELPAGNSASLTLEVKPRGGDWSATVTVRGSELDPDMSNNTATVRVVG